MNFSIISLCNYVNVVQGDFHIMIGIIGEDSGLGIVIGMLIRRMIGIIGEDSDLMIVFMIV